MYRTFFLLATSSRIEILNYYNSPFYYTGIEHSRIERLFLTFLKEFLTKSETKLKKERKKVWQTY